MNKKRTKALITGVNGQDGSYLAELLLEKGYDVVGFSNGDRPLEKWLVPLAKSSDIRSLDIADRSAVEKLLMDVQPDEIYNLAAQSHVGRSFDIPHETAEITGIGALNILEAARKHAPDARIYQASSSEMFGNSVEPDGTQRETTPMDPTSPYASAKVFAYHLSRIYRSIHGMFVSNGILFNHESPRRGINFVTSKVCREAVKIKYGRTDKLCLGNIDSRRDWGHAKDYVRAMWLILQQDAADDFVCATGISHSVRDLTQHVFDRLDLDMEKYVEIDKGLLRPEANFDRRGDAGKLRSLTGWRPEYTFETMLDEMVDYWLEELK